MALIDYPDTLPKTQLVGNQMQGGSSFIRSNFDYATRQRKTFCNDYMVKFRFVCSSNEQMLAFKDFYYQTLSNGVSVFNAAWLIEGDEEVKEFRFASVYSLVQLTKDIWAITAEFQMITKVKELGLGKHLLLDLPLLGSLVPRKSANPATDVTFTRATTASYIDRNGVLQYAAIDEARFESDGLLVEGGSTNSALDSGDYTTGNWAAQNVSLSIGGKAPDGISNSTKVIKLAGTSTITQVRSIIVGESYTNSFYVKRLKGNGAIGIVDTNGIYLYFGDEIGTEWVRINVSNIADSTAGRHYIRMLTDGDEIEIWGSQLEQLPFASSYIPTTTAAVTRGSDVCSVKWAGNAPRNEEASTVIIDAKTRNIGAGNLFDLEGISGLYDIYTYGTNVAFRKGGSLVTSIDNTVFNRLAISSSKVLAVPYVNGIAASQGFAATSTGIAANGVFYLGNRNGGSQFIYGHLKNYLIYDKSLSATEMSPA